MHYHLEVVMPPTEDVKGAVAALLEPFNESTEKETDEDGDPVDTSHAFWDFWVIGGRWAGKKMEARIGKDRIAEFFAWCRDAGIMVNGVSMGKQTIASSEMRAQVDAKWREMFPDTFAVCPLFDHANDQLGLRGESALAGDVAKLKDVPLTMECAHVLIAGPKFGGPGRNYDDPALWNGPLETRFMVTESVWNGVNHLDVKWDGTLADALRLHAEKMKGYRDACRIASTPSDDWLVVTVDYHS